MLAELTKSSAAPDVVVHDVRLDGSMRARRYALAGAQPAAPVVALLHGVHPEGIDEPRLMRLARVLANAGLVVVTPELDALASARLDSNAPGEVAQACDAIARQEGRAAIGVVGISFGGGLALVAAPRSRAMGVILAIGAHHDAARLARRWLTSGHSHERYGAQVLAHAYWREYFEGVEDAEVAREALADLLRSDRAAFRSRSLSAEARARIEPLRTELGSAAPRLRAIVDAHAAELAALSPASRLAHVRIPVFLLHGAHDPLIASTESVRIYEELPATARGGLVRTRLLGHADRREVGLFEELEVVHLVAGFLGALEALPHERGGDGSAGSSTRP